MEREVIDALAALKASAPHRLQREVMVLQVALERCPCPAVRMMPDGPFSDDEREGRRQARQMKSVIDDIDWNAARTRLQQEMIDAATRVLAYTKAGWMEMSADGIKVTIELTSAPQFNG